MSSSSLPAKQTKLSWEPACKISLSPGRLRVWVVYKYPLPLPPLIHFLAFKRGQVAQLLSFANVNLLCRALFLWAVACQRPCVGSSLEIRDLCFFFFFGSREGVSHPTKLEFWVQFRLICQSFPLILKRPAHNSFTKIHFVKCSFVLWCQQDIAIY